MSRGTPKNKGEIAKPKRSPNTEEVNAANLRGVEASAVVSIARSFEGPLPPPTFLKQYEDAMPGAADRIFSLAESQSRHRIETERRLLEAEIEDENKSRTERRLGQWLAFWICIIAILSGAVISVMGQATAGVLIGAVGLTPLVSTFITGRRSEKESKSDEK